MKRRQALTANRANFNSRFLHLLCMTLFFLHGLLQLLLHFLVCFFSSFLFSNARFFFLQQQNTSADEFLHDRGTVKNQRMEDVTDLFVFNLALFCDALLQLLLLHGIYSFGLLQSVHERWRRRRRQLQPLVANDVGRIQANVSQSAAGGSRPSRCEFLIF